MICQRQGAARKSGDLSRKGEFVEERVSTIFFCTELIRLYLAPTKAECR